MEENKEMVHKYKIGMKVRVKQFTQDSYKSEDGGYNFTIAVVHRERQGKIITIDDCLKSGKTLYYYADGEVWVANMLEVPTTKLEYDQIIEGAKASITKHRVKRFECYEELEAFKKQIEQDKNFVNIKEIYETN